MPAARLWVPDCDADLLVAIPPTIEVLAWIGVALALLGLLVFEQSDHSQGLGPG
jgi:hypothetical protein